MSIVAKRFISLLIGVGVLLIALLLPRFNLIRAIFVLISIISLTYSFSLERTNKKVFVSLFVILFFFFVTSLDYLNCVMFKHTPILAYSIVKTENGTVYNALGYRVWSCSNDTFKVDPLYKLGYYCKENTMTSESINNVLTTIYDNFEDYQDSYVSVIGRVKEVVDNKTFYMQMFKDDDGVIKFNEAYNLYVEFNYEYKDLNTLDSNTLVVVLGKISKKEGNNIYMIDAKISKQSSVGSDTLKIEAEKNIYCQYDKELWFETNTNIFYRSCIDDVNITISNNQYNLVNALKNNLITLDELKNESIGYTKQSKDNSIMYNYKDFKILVCDESTSRDIIMGNNELELSYVYCNVSNTQRGV